MPNPSPTRFEDRLLAELDQIKRLLIALLAERGLTQQDIASALGVNQSTISRMFPASIGRNGNGARRKRDRT